MARLHRHDVAADGATEEREVADDIENLVPDEFVRKRSGSLLKTESPRTTMAFSRLPPLIRFFSING